MRKVRVKIAVAVDPSGDWEARGWKDGTDEEKMANATEQVAEGEARYFLEADLFVPEVVTIQPSVKRV